MNYRALLSNKIVIILVIIIAFGVIILFNIERLKREKKIEEFNAIDYSEEIKSFSRDEKVGHVPDSETAKIVAENFWVKIYGEKVKKTRPYKVSYDTNNKIWLVEGTISKNMVGGTPYMLISQQEGNILAVWHTK